MKRTVIYKADDGTEFDDPGECERYEVEQAAKKAAEEIVKTVFPHGILIIESQP